VVTLFRFGPAWDKFGCISQFVLKIETYLRMAGIEFETRSLGIGFAETAPKGKLPYIEHDGAQIADSSIIVDYLKEHFGDPLDEALSSSERAKGHAIKRMVEEHIWWIMARERWWAPENPYWDTPGMLKEFDQASFEEARDDSRRKCIEHGVGAFTEDELDKRGREDLNALAAFLGEHPYILGDQPTSVDATTYAFLWQIMNGPYTSQLKDAAQEHDNLAAYVQRMSKEWFGNDPMSLEREVS
jgi:glutathione S-transferase